LSKGISCSLLSALALRLVEWIVTLVDRLHALRWLSHLCGVYVLGPPEEPERGDDYVRNVALLAFTILATAQLKPSFNIEFPLRRVLCRDLTRFVPTDAMKPLDANILLPNTGFEPISSAHTSLALAEPRMSAKVTGFPGGFALPRHISRTAPITIKYGRRAELRRPSGCYQILPPRTPRKQSVCRRDTCESQFMFF